MAGSKYYGQFGGQYVSESLMNTLAELEKAFDEAIETLSSLRIIFIICRNMLEGQLHCIMQRE